MLELLDIPEEAFDLVAGFVDIVVELIVHLISPVNLRLEVFHRSVNIAQRTLLRVVFGFLLFEMGFQLVVDMLACLTHN